MSETKIKLCGLTRESDIEVANQLLPEYIGFVFAKKSRRYLSPERAKELRTLLRAEISAVGVFVREEPEIVAELLQSGVIDAAQLHGGEDAAYVARLRALTDHPIIQAFRADRAKNLLAAAESRVDCVLLDSGEGGTGSPFDWNVLQTFPRPYFLAGGLNPENVADAIDKLHPYAVDVSSGIETDGKKDPEKMRAFVRAVRNERKSKNG